MVFVFSERESFVRSATHTVVFDDDPDYPRFRTDPSGHVERFVYVWLAETERAAITERVYLGAVRLCSDRPIDRPGVRPLLERLRDAVGARETERLAPRLVGMLRWFHTELATV